MPPVWVDANARSTLTRDCIRAAAIPDFDAMTRSVRSPRREARIAGALYLLIILLGVFAELGVREGLVRPGDFLATAQAIRGHELLFRLGFASEMAVNLLAIPVTLIVYRLLVPVDRGLALMAIVFDLTQNTVNAVNAWTQFAPLTLLRGGAELAAIPLAERAAWARLALRHRTDLLRRRPFALCGPDRALDLLAALARRALRPGRVELLGQQLQLLHGAEPGHWQLSPGDLPGRRRRLRPLAAGRGNRRGALARHGCGERLAAAPRS